MSIYSDLTALLMGCLPLTSGPSPDGHKPTDYEQLETIGRGFFGRIFKAKSKKTGKLVAMKEIHSVPVEGLPGLAMRESSFLQEFARDRVACDHIAKLIAVVRNPGVTEDQFTEPIYFFIMEYCEHNLHGLLRNKDFEFSPELIRSIMLQLLTGLGWLHDREYIHQNVEPKNILITKDGVVKLVGCESLSQVHGNEMKFKREDPQNEEQECYQRLPPTPCYCPPELLLLMDAATTAFDLWGAGCVFAEMWTRSPIMQGDTVERKPLGSWAKDQLQAIVKLCGSITTPVWPAAVNLHSFKKLQLPQNINRQVKDTLRNSVTDRSALDLLDSLLKWDPAQRLTCRMAANGSYFGSYQVHEADQAALAEALSDLPPYAEPSEPAPSSEPSEPAASSEPSEPAPSSKPSEPETSADTME